MMACEHHDELVALGAMRLLLPEDEGRLAERLRACASCRRQFEEYRSLVEMMPQLVRVEMAPARAEAAQPAPASLNGHRPSAGPSTGQPPTSEAEEPPDLFAPRRWGTPIHPHPRRARHRLTTFASGLAAAVLLIGLIAGFRLLTLARTSTPVAHPACPTPGSGSAKPVTCGVLVVDSTLGVMVLDSATLRPLPGLSPLSLDSPGDVVLSALSADQRALAVVTGFSKGNLYFPVLQVIALDRWESGSRLDLSDTGAVIQGLAISADGSSIYVVATTSTGSSTAQTQIMYYTYERGSGGGTLQQRWVQPFPVTPEAGAVALSADGSMIYAFSDSGTTSEVAAIPLKEDGLDLAHMRTLSLPDVAGGSEPAPSPSPDAQPEDQPAAAYHPAVLFSPDGQTLSLVHADRTHPEHDMLTVVALGPEPAILREIPIQGGASFPTSSGSTIVQRHEWGALSPDEKTIYLTGVVKTFSVTQDGGVTQQNSYLGLQAIDAQTGQSSKHWFDQDAFSYLGISADGTRLYLAGQPSSSAKTVADPAALLAFTPATGALQSYNLAGVGALFVLSSR